MRRILAVTFVLAAAAAFVLTASGAKQESGSRFTVELDTSLADMPRADIDAIKGVGRAIGDKIQELLLTGDMQTFRKYADETPPGVVDMLSIKGFGPKKIQAVWKELGIETVGELLYACNEIFHDYYIKSKQNL